MDEMVDSSKQNGITVATNLARGREATLTKAVITVKLKTEGTVW